ncbi:MAG TPA: transglutaminase family protein [Planctomicrobium sp.]|nr:transglutaminase family protein [Planctomicrobium sp.]
MSICGGITDGKLLTGRLTGNSPRPGLPLRKVHMKRIRIIHRTEYFYSQPVTFGPHRALLRPREGHEVHIAGSRLEIEPAAEIRWLRDIEGNSVAILTFNEPSDRLRLFAEMDVDLCDDNPIECLISPQARLYPFQYDPNEQVELLSYRLPSYPYDGPALHDWLLNLYRPGQVVETFELLNRLNTQIFEFLQYSPRDDHGVQLPHETLERGIGSCRDYAVLMMEAARYWGFGARFVTGYIQMAEGQHGATHAWTEVYLPGAGWRGFDPTNNKLVGSEHISVAVAREQEKAAPLSGSWEGPAGSFERMEVSVQVIAMSPAATQTSRCASEKNDVDNHLPCS